MTIAGLLERLYLDKNSPAFLAGKLTLLRLAKRANPDVKLRHVNEFLSTQEVYTLHKPPRYHFPRNKIIATGIDSHWQIDLADLSRLKHQNNYNRYILTGIDVFSKFCFAEPIKFKRPEDVLAAFKRIRKRTGRKPLTMMADKGNEFKGVFRKYLANQGIHFYFAPNPVIKAANVERFNRTLKNRMWRYFTHNSTKRYVNVLQTLIDNINHTITRTHRMRPVDVNNKNEALVRRRLYGGDEHMDRKHRPKFKVGDRVRVALWRKLFDKGYTRTYTKDTFVIDQCIHREIPVYRIKDADGNVIDRIFYAQQMQKV